MKNTLTTLKLRNISTLYDTVADVVLVVAAIALPIYIVLMA